MFYKKLVREAYNEAVKLHPTANQELKHSLNSNERVPKFIDDIANEIAKVQDVMIAKGADKIKDETIKGLVYDMTNMFIQSVEKRAEFMHMSEAQKMLIKQKQDYQKDLETMGGDIGDIIKEGGVQFVEDRS
jgi:hypothetical protein